MTITACMPAVPVCRRVPSCVGVPGALPMQRMLPSMAKAMPGRLHRHARVGPADGLMHIDVEDKCGRRELFMVEAVLGWPARA